MSHQINGSGEPPPLFYHTHCSTEMRLLLRSCLPLFPTDKNRTQTFPHISCLAHPLEHQQEALTHHAWLNKAVLIVTDKRTYRGDQVKKNKPTDQTSKASKHSKRKWIQRNSPGRYLSLHCRRGNSSWRALGSP